MPRRYHRPPTVKRRKARRAGPSIPFEEGGAPNGEEPSELSPDELEDGEWDEEDALEETATSAAGAPGARQPPSREGLRHIQRDYSYVRSELQRIAVVAAILVIALLIAAILR